MSSPQSSRSARLAGVVAALALAACGDAPTTPPGALGPVAPLSSVQSVQVGSSLAWNKVARDIVSVRNAGSPGPQARVLTYLSVAQYNAVVAAEGVTARGDRPAAAAAVAGASLVVLRSFLPLDAAQLDATLAAQRNSAPWTGELAKSWAAGEALGRSIGAAVLASAATDRAGLMAAPVNPRGPGNWTGSNPLRGNIGARTFALTSDDQFRPGPPPAFGSPAYLEALAEVRAASDGLTPAQLAIAQLWAARGPAFMNEVAAGMIAANNRPERDAARIFAVANMAGFDVLDACFDAKLAYYFIRPSQADPLIKLPVGLPNHPSYPSGHSCITSAYATVLANAFPAEQRRLDAMVTEAGLARLYAGLHYTFDLKVGRELGRKVGQYVLQVAPRTTAIPLY